MNTVLELEFLFAQLGQALYMAGRHAEAVEILEKAIQEGGEESSKSGLYVTLGKSYKALNRREEALNAFTLALKLDPNTFDEIEQDINEIQASAPPPGPKNRVIDKFVKRLRKFLPQTPDNLYQAADKLIQEGNFKRAKSILKLIMNYWPEDLATQERLAEVYFLQGELIESKGLFEKLAARDDQNPKTFARLGEIYLQMKQYERAADEFHRALELDPNNPDYLLGRGTALRKLKKYAESEQYLARATELQPDNPLLRHELALNLKAGGRKAEAVTQLLKAVDLSYHAGDYAEAERMALEALDMDPTRAETYEIFGRILHSQGRSEEAIMILGKGASHGERAGIYSANARIFSNLGEPERSLEYARKALSIDPSWEEARQIEARALQQMGLFGESLEILDQYLADHPEAAWAYTAKGEALEAIGQYSEALACYQQAAELRPDEQRVQVRLGSLFYDLGDYQASLEHLNKALEVEPQAEIFSLKGKCLYVLDQHEEAADAFQQALKLNPDDADALLYRGVSLRITGRYDESVQMLQEAIDVLSSLDAETNLNQHYAELGETLRLMGREREAKFAFQKALRYQPDDQWTLAHYAETLRTLEHYEEAIEVFHKALALNPEDAWSWASLGAAYSGMDKYRSALEALNKAIELSPENVWAMGYKGVVLRMVQRYQEAIDTFDQALSLSENESWILIEKSIALRLWKKEGSVQGVELLKKAEVIEKDNSWLYLQLSICQYLAGNYQEAKEAAQKAIELNSSLIIAYQVLGLAYEKLGDMEKAEEMNEKSLDPLKTADAYLTRGADYSSLYEYEKAIEDFRKAMELSSKEYEQNPEITPETLAVVYNEEAWLYVEYMNERFEEARVLAEKGLDYARRGENKIREKNLLDTLAWAYYKLGKPAEALPLLEQAASLDTEDLVIADHLIEVREMLAKQEGSIASSTPGLSV